MKIIIAGDGKVGALLTGQLSGEGHDLTLIDRNPDALEASIERYDVMAVVGNCASMEILRNAGVENADLLIAATGEDELNLLTCMTAHGLNPDLHTIARIRTPDYYESTVAMRDLFALSLTVNPDRQMAREILRVLHYPGCLKREKFANGLVEIVEIKVEPGSVLDNRPLHMLNSLVHCQALVCAVLRDGRSVTPGGDFVMRGGDLLFVTASAGNLATLLKNIGMEVPRIRNVVIAGGGRAGFYLTQVLVREGMHVKIIEKDLRRCEYLVENLPEVMVIHGDISKRAVLDRESVGGADAVISMTNLDEVNVLLSLYASQAKVPQVITKLGRGDNLELLEQLSIGSLVSPKDLCCDTITRYVRAMDNQVGAAVTMHTIADGQAEAIEFIVEPGTKHIGEPLKTLQLKKNVLIASITRGRDIIIPNGDSSFETGDSIVVVTSEGTVIQQINDIFL